LTRLSRTFLPDGRFAVQTFTTDGVTLDVYDTAGRPERQAFWRWPTTDQPRKFGKNDPGRNFILYEPSGTTLLGPGGSRRGPGARASESRRSRRGPGGGRALRVFPRAPPRSPSPGWSSGRGRPTAICGRRPPAESSPTFPQPPPPRTKWPCRTTGGFWPRARA